MYGHDQRFNLGCNFPLNSETGLGSALNRSNHVDNSDIATNVDAPSCTCPLDGPDARYLDLLVANAAHFLGEVKETGGSVGTSRVQNCAALRNIPDCLPLLFYLLRPIE
jgi:hypothetical protein